MRILFTFFLLLLNYNLEAQIIITGKVTDEARNPVGGVSVSYTRPNQKAILGFARTTDNGSFKLNLQSVDTDSVTLVFNHMSYARKSVNIPVKTADYTFTLEIEAREFEAIKITQRPVNIDKDTISYHVGAFTSPQDRVIGDIIKKLPGIEMYGGKILYQGKPIQKYMVNNLDLMEGRYEIINNNLPVDAVRNVQIVENNQPIKILDSLVFSDRASLNIELKKFTSTGSGKAGIGAGPALWLGNLTPMTFGKTFQMLNTFQTNNTGQDVSAELRPFYTGTGGYFGGASSVSAAPSYISVRNVSSPDFDPKRWLDNKIFLTGTNLLKKLKSGIELKGNASYYNDTQNRRGITSTQYFTSQEIIYNREEISNRYKTNALNVGLLLEKNEKNIFLKNTFFFNKRWNNDTGNLLFNSDMPVKQKRDYTDMVLLNTLSAARFLGKQLVNINSGIEYHHTPQRLWVTPGQFDSILNQGKPGAEMEQHVLFRSFKWNNSLGFTRRVRNLRLTPALGINYTHNHLDSYIAVDQQAPKGELYSNDIQNSLLETFVNLGLNWENQSWKLFGQAPLSMNMYQLRPLPNELRVTFRPSAGLTYIIDHKNELGLNTTGGNSLGGLDNFYDGYIISQYRNMQRYEARLLETKNWSSFVSYRFKNISKASFANLGYGYSQSGRDYIFNTFLDSLGRNTTQINDQNSRTLSHRMNGSFSQFFTRIKTIVKLNSNTSWTQADYLLNGLMGKQHNFSYSTGLDVMNTYLSKFSVDYKITLGQSNNRLAGGKSNKLTYSTQMLNLNYYPAQSHNVSINNAYYRNNIVGQQNQFFVDVRYRYTIKKWKTDVEFTAFNLLNNNNYVQQFSTTYELIKSSFELRPRQFFVSTNFRF